MCCGLRLARAFIEGTSIVFKKDIGLLILILVVGTVVAVINPLFLSAINLGNTANLVGLFGIFAIGQAFVIITGGIELSVGSIIALLGVLFVDLIVGHEMAWPLALVIMMGIGGVDWTDPWPADYPHAHAALYRHTVRIAHLSWCGAVLYTGRHSGIWLWGEPATTRVADNGAHFWRAPFIHGPDRYRLPHVGGSASFGVRPLSLCGGQERGSGALFRHPHQPGDHCGLCDLGDTYGHLGDFLCHVHAVDFAIVTWQFL